jgi:uncharacterized membrane-anchored protein YjiN (DUF445 family)
MKHRRGKHVIVDLLGIAAGGLLTAAVLQRSWFIGIIALILATTAGFLDWFNIEEEESHDGQ